MQPYPPSEDSFFLAEEIKQYLKNLPKKEKSEIKALDLGTGSGIQAENLIKQGIKSKNILASDINPESIKKARKLGIKAIKSNLFSKIKYRFDLIIFNPPYLPESEYDREKDTSGGKKGDETIIKFLKQVKFHLAENGKAIILLSSLTPRTRINKEIKKQKLKAEKLAEKKLFFEQLEVRIIFSRQSQKILIF